MYGKTSTFASLPCAAGLGAALVVQGCSGQIRLNGFGHEVIIFIRPANPNALVTLPCLPEYLFEVPFEGDTYEIWDYSCDGVGDFARAPDDRWYRVRPVPQLDGNGPGTGSRRGPTAYEVDLDHAFAAPLEFDFGDLTAPEWIAAMGLDVEPGDAAHTMLLDMSFNLGTWQTEVLLPWSSAFAIPDIEDFQGNFEADFLHDETGKGPAFAVLHLRGHLVEVLQYLLLMSAGYLSLELSDPDTGIVWLLEADAATGMATLSVNGEPFQQVPLG